MDDTDPAVHLLKTTIEWLFSTRDGILSAENSGIQRDDGVSIAAR
jgi:hypothetical protein